MADDIYYNNVSLLLHCDGTNGSTTFTDNSPTPKTITPSGNAQISTAQSKFGGASALFDGAGDWISVGTPDDFVFGTGDFTIEEWVYPTESDSFRTIYSQESGYAAVGNIFITLHNLQPYIWIDTVAVFPLVGTVSINTWSHIALTRNGTNLRLFINGIQVGTTITNSASITCASGFPSIGNPSGSWFAYKGYLDDCRVTKGIARYTTNFTAPTTPFGDSLPRNIIVGSVPVTIAVAATLHKQLIFSVTESIPATVTPAAGMHLHLKFALTGSIPLTVTPASPKHRRAHYFLTETVAITTVVAATLKKYHQHTLVGAIPLTTAVNAVLLESHRNQIIGSIPVITTVAAALCEAVIWTAAFGFTLPTLTATSHFNAPNTIELGFIDTTLEALGGWNATGDFLDITLSSTGTLLETLSAELPLFESTLSCSVTVDERITASLGFFESTVTALGGANAALTFPVFGLSTIAASEWNRANASLGFPALALTATATVEQRMAFAFGFIDTYLSYCSIDVTAPVFSLAATAHTDISNSVAYVLNTVTQESYQWTNQNFNHIICIGNRYFGVTSTGLYEVSTNYLTDNGVAINATITGKDSDMGSANHSQRVPKVYLNNDCVTTTVQPIVDGVSKNVHTVSYAGREAKLGRGYHGRYWQFKVAGIVKLEGLHYEPEKLQRYVK